MEGHLSSGLGGGGSALHPIFRVEWDKGGCGWFQWSSEPPFISGSASLEGGGSPAGQGLGPFSLRHLLPPLPPIRVSIVTGMATCSVFAVNKD